MNGGPSGFHNAPVTRTFVTASALLTVLLGIQGRSQKLGLSYQGRYPSPPRASAAELPAETSVATLVSMCFDSNSARQASIHAGNDVSVATNILLEAQSR